MTYAQLIDKLKKEYDDMVNGTFKHGVAVVQIIGREGLEICGYDTKQTHKACDGDVLKFRTNGKSLAAIIEQATPRVSERRIVLWDDLNAYYYTSGLIAAVDGGKWGCVTHSLALGSDLRCYVGTCLNAQGQITCFEKRLNNVLQKTELVPVKSIQVNVAPYVLANVHGNIYCAGNNKIISLDEGLNETREFANLDLDAGRVITELEFSGDSKTKMICALTNDVKGISKAFAWIDGLPYLPLASRPISHTAFAAAVVGGKAAFFYGDKNKIELKFPKEPKESKYLQLDSDADVLALRFDPIMHYLFANTANQVYILPFYPRDGCLIENKTPIFFSNTNKIKDVRVAIK
jgi:hypothetical protein